MKLWRPSVKLGGARLYGSALLRAFGFCRVPPLYPLTRAREGRADLSAVCQQRDPLAPPAGRRRHFLNSGWGLVRPRRRRIGTPDRHPKGALTQI